MGHGRLRWSPLMAPLSTGRGVGAAQARPGTHRLPHPHPVPQQLFNPRLLRLLLAVCPADVAMAPYAAAVLHRASYANGVAGNEASLPLLTDSGGFNGDMVFANRQVGGLGWSGWQPGQHCSTPLATSPLGTGSAGVCLQGAGSCGGASLAHLARWW